MSEKMYQWIVVQGLDTGDFFQTIVGVHQGCHLIQVLLNIFLEKIIQEDLTLQHPSEDGCFAGDAVNDAEEIDTPLSSVFTRGRPLCNLQLLITSICWEGRQ